MDRTGGDTTKQRWGFVIGPFAVFTLYLVAHLILGQFIHASDPPPPESSAGNMELSRGTLADRTGYWIAMDVFEYSVDISPANLTSKERDRLADALAPITNLPWGEIRAALDTQHSFVSLDGRYDGSVAAAIRKLDSPVVKTVAHPTRYYPEGLLAANLTGFVNAVPVGCYGVEEYYESALKREVVKIEDLGSASMQRLQSASTTLTLAIDRYAQKIAEEELDKGMKLTRSASGQVIVMVPQTGEILAMAVRPTYSPAEYWKAASGTWTNPAISEVYEPGSVFKLITYAAALDHKTITPSDLFYDSGMIEVGGRKIYNWDRAGHGTVDILDALGNSLNVVAAGITQKMGRDAFYNYVRKFGFGLMTEIDLTGEVPGLVKTPNDPRWSDSDLGTNSFGQGISVTPIQMLSAVASIANGGMLMSPQVVIRKTVGAEVTDMQSRAVRRTISSRTAQTLTSLLVRVVDEYLPEAQIPGYSIAGKTGTAEIPIGGAYHPTDYIASFIGYGPASNPQLIILVKMDRPQVGRSGREAAAPVFRSVATRLFKYMHIAPDRAN